MPQCQPAPDGRPSKPLRILRLLGWLLTVTASVHWLLLAVDRAQPEPASAQYLTFGGVGADGGAPGFPAPIGQLIIDVVDHEGVASQRTCSASVVSNDAGNDNGSVVLTAAHCFHDEVVPESLRARFVPGAHVVGGSVVQPHGSWLVSGVISGWPGSDEGSPSDDIAFAVVCPRSNGGTVAGLVGSLSLTKKPSTDGLVASVGYPRLGDQIDQMHRPYVVLSEAVSRRSPFPLGRASAIVLNADDEIVAGGMSGAPVILNYEPLTDRPSGSVNEVGHVVTAMGGSSDGGTVFSHFIAQRIDDRAWHDFEVARASKPGQPGSLDMHLSPCATKKRTNR